MIGIPTPEAVEPISDADLAERAKWLDCNGPTMANLTVGEARSIIARLRLAEARALPLPRSYTGGPLEDGLYLWRRRHWHATSWATFGVEGGTPHPYTGPATIPPDEWVWLIGPIHIPPIPKSEEASS